MTSSQPAVRTQLARQAERIEVLEEQYRTLFQSIQQTESRCNERLTALELDVAALHQKHADRIDELEKRVDEIPARRTKGPHRPDAKGVLILDWLSRFPNIMWRPVGIADQLDMSSGEVSGRLKTMADKGLVKAIQEEGKGTRYQHLKKEVSDA